MRKRWLVLVLAFALVAPVAAQNQGQGEKGKPQKTQEKDKGKSKAKEAGEDVEKEKGKGKDDEKGKSSEDEGRVAAQRELKSYYEKGGAKPADLPPGIARNLQRGKPLPPGIQKAKVPDGLAAKLPKRPGEEWSMVGNRLVSTDKAGIVKDVITP